MIRSLCEAILYDDVHTYNDTFIRKSIYDNQIRLITVVSIPRANDKCITELIRVCEDESMSRYARKTNRQHVQRRRENPDDLFLCLSSGIDIFMHATGNRSLDRWFVHGTHTRPSDNNEGKVFTLGVEHASAGGSAEQGLLTFPMIRRVENDDDVRKLRTNGTMIDFTTNKMKKKISNELSKKEKHRRTSSATLQNPDLVKLAKISELSGLDFRVIITQHRADSILENLKDTQKDGTGLMGMQVTLKDIITGLDELNLQLGRIDKRFLACIDLRAEHYLVDPGTLLNTIHPSLVSARKAGWIGTQMVDAMHKSFFSEGFSYGGMSDELSLSPLSSSQASSTTSSSSSSSSSPSPPSSSSSSSSSSQSSSSSSSHADGYARGLESDLQRQLGDIDNLCSRLP
jgi:hypothetical protein